MVQKVLTCKATMHWLKSILFDQVTLLSTNVVLMSIFQWYLLRIMTFLVQGRGEENIGKEKKTDRRKRLTTR